MRSTHRVLEVVPSALQVLDLILTAPLGYCCHPHSIDEKTDIHRDGRARSGGAGTRTLHAPQSVFITTIQCRLSQRSKLEGRGSGVGWGGGHGQRDGSEILLLAKTPCPGGPLRLDQETRRETWTSSTWICTETNYI